MMSSVAVIGLGAMGGSLAARLVECGVKVHGYDISMPAIQRLQARGGEASTNLEAALAGADVIICNLPNDEIVLSVIHGGMLDLLRPSQSLVEMSTILPTTMITVSQALRGRVREIIDAPVSGGPPEAKIGKLSLLVGSEKDIESRTHDILSKLGSVLLVGGGGWRWQSNEIDQ